MRRLTLFCLLALVCAVGISTINAQIQLDEGNTYYQYVTSLTKPVIMCPFGSTCSAWTRVPGTTDQWVRAIQDGPDVLPFAGRGHLNPHPFITDDSDPWGEKRVELPGLRPDEMVVVEVVRDIAVPMVRESIDFDDGSTICHETELGERICITPVGPLACYDNARDCGDVAERYCSSRVPPQAVTLNVYTPGVERPCSFTCADGTNGTCQRTPAKPMPKPIDPGQQTLPPLNDDVVP